jgi:hypothetical protein
MMSEEAWQAYDMLGPMTENAADKDSDVQPSPAQALM